MHIKGCDLFIAFFCLVTYQMYGRVSNCRNFNGTNPPFLGGFSPYALTLMRIHKISVIIKQR